MSDSLDSEDEEDFTGISSFKTRQREASITEDELRLLLGFQPRGIILGTSYSINKCKYGKEVRDVLNPEYWKDYKVRWEHLPDIVLEQIIGYLSIPYRHVVSQVCRNWYKAFHLPGCWRHFVLDDNTLTKRKYTREFGYVTELDHYRMQMCLQKVSPFWNTIRVRPMSNLMNLLNFVTLAAHFSQIRRELYEFDVYKNVYLFEFIFSPDHLQLGAGERHENAVYGTGGQVLKGVVNFLHELHHLRHVVLTNLLLDKVTEAVKLLDEVAENCAKSLISLNIVNLTRGPLIIHQISLFVNLQILYLSPQNLHPNSLLIVAEQCRKLKEIHVVHNHFTEMGMMISGKHWLTFKKTSPQTKVKLVLGGRSKGGIVWQDRCPVDSIVVDTRLHSLKTEFAVTATSLYAQSLENFIWLGLPRFRQSKRFAGRCDSSLVLFVRQCVHLRRLVIREVISTSTLLLIAYYGKRSNLNLLVVRANAIRKKFDFPINPEWSIEFVKWLKHCSRTFEACFAEVRQMLGDPHWRPLSDKEFVKLNDYRRVLKCDVLDYKQLA